MWKRMKRRLGLDRTTSLVVDVSRDDDGVNTWNDSDDDAETDPFVDDARDDAALRQRRPKETAREAKERYHRTIMLRKFTLVRLTTIADELHVQSKAEAWRKRDGSDRSQTKQWRKPTLDFHIGTHTLTLQEVEDALLWKTHRTAQLRADYVSPQTVRMGQAWTGQWGEGEVLRPAPEQLKEVGADDITLNDIWGLKKQGAAEEEGPGVWWESEAADAGAGGVFGGNAWN